MSSILQPTYQRHLFFTTDKHSVYDDPYAVMVLFNSKAHADAYRSCSYEELRCKLQELLTFYYPGHNISSSERGGIRDTIGLSELVAFTFLEAIDARTHASISMQPTYATTLQCDLYDDNYIGYISAGMFFDTKQQCDMLEARSFVDLHASLIDIASRVYTHIDFDKVTLQAVSLDDEPAYFGEVLDMRTHTAPENDSCS